MKSTLRALLLLALVLGGVAGYAAATDQDLDRYLPLTAAPDYHRVIFENDLVRVLDVSIPAGNTVPAHQHDLPSIFITLSEADLVFRNLAGETVRDVRRARDSVETPRVEWREPASEPRVVSNIDSVDFHALRVELKISRR